MENSVLNARKRKVKRVLRLKSKIRGTSERPRLCISRTNQNFGVQVIDDIERKTIVSFTTSSKDFKKSDNKSKTDLAKLIGVKVAESCKELGVTKAVLDRRGCKYHGVIAAFADSAREKGLKF